MRDGTDISDFRENLLFGQAHLGDVDYEDMTPVQWQVSQLSSSGTP